jgi:hypothetical protein
MSEYVDINTLLNTVKIQNVDNTQESIYFDNIDIEEDQVKKISTLKKENNIKIYQLQGIIDKNDAQLVYIGDCNIRPTILLYEFADKEYSYDIVSFVLTDVDIDESSKSCSIKILSLRIKSDKNIKGIITLEYHTFNHTKDKCHLNTYICNNSNEILPTGLPYGSTCEQVLLNGFYMVYFKGINTDKKKLGILKAYPGKSNLVYTIIQYLTHQTVIENI